MVLMVDSILGLGVTRARLMPGWGAQYYLDVWYDKNYYNFNRLRQYYNSRKILDEKLKKGDTILCMVPESARFSYVYLMLTAV